jgi:hypothetical protein
MTDSIGDLLASHDLCVEDLPDDLYDQDNYESNREPLTIEEWRTLHSVANLEILVEELIF